MESKLDQVISQLINQNNSSGFSITSHEGGQNSPRADLLLISDIKNKYKQS